MIRIGCCCDGFSAGILRQSGFDYAELSLSSLYSMPEEEYIRLRTSLEISGLQAECFNCIFSGQPIRIVGIDADQSQLMEYASKSMERAADLGGKLRSASRGRRLFPSEGTPAAARSHPIIGGSGGRAWNGFGARAADNRRNQSAQHRRRRDCPLRRAKSSACGPAGRSLSYAAKRRGFWYSCPGRKLAAACALLQSGRAMLSHHTRFF